MGNCLFKPTKQIILPNISPTSLPNISPTSLPNISPTSPPNISPTNLIIPNNKNNHILSYFFFNKPDKNYDIFYFNETTYQITIYSNNNWPLDTIYSFNKGTSGFIYIYNYKKHLSKFLYPNFLIYEIRTKKYLRNKSAKFFMIICNFVKYVKNETIKYRYAFIKGIQYKLEFKYYLHNDKTLEIKKYYFANKVYIRKIYSNLSYDKNKILIRNKYELHYCSKYFHYL
jgi:hypothetical protein